MIPNIIIYIIGGLVVTFIVLIIIIASFEMYETIDNSNTKPKRVYKKNKKEDLYDPSSREAKMYSLPFGITNGR